MAGHRLGALEGGGGCLPPFQCIPGGGQHKAMVLVCLPLAAPIGLSNPQCEVWRGSHTARKDRVAGVNLHLREQDPVLPRNDAEHVAARRDAERLGRVLVLERRAHAHVPRPRGPVVHLEVHGVAASVGGLGLQRELHVGLGGGGEVEGHFAGVAAALIRGPGAGVHDVARGLAEHFDHRGSDVALGAQELVGCATNKSGLQHRVRCTQNFDRAHPARKTLK